MEQSFGGCLHSKRFVVEGAGVGGWGICSKGKGREGAPEVCKPRFDDRRGHKVDFVEDED